MSPAYYGAGRANKEIRVKECFKCGKTKRAAEFYKHPQMGDGRLGKCKECTIADVQKYYSKTFPDRQEYERRRFKNPERKAKVAEYQRRMRAANPERTKARSSVSNAVRDGKIKKLPCGVCGSTKSEAHHKDYSKPLDVQWLCRPHHRMAHGQLKHLTEKN